MTTVERSPGGSTQIRVSVEVREMIEKEKIIPREPLNECIKRVILENRKARPHSSIEILERRDEMLRETPVLIPQHEHSES